MCWETILCVSLMFLHMLRREALAAFVWFIFSWMCVEQTARAEGDCDFPGAKGRFTALPKRCGFLHCRFLSTPWRCFLAQGHQLRGIGRGTDTPASHCNDQSSPLALTGRVPCPLPAAVTLPQANREAGKQSKISDLTVPYMNTLERTENILRPFSYSVV